MQKYQDVVLDAMGNAIAGASVQVLQYPSSSVATIYSDNGITQTINPLTTDSLGRFSFFAANGNYTLQVSSPFITTVTVSDIQLFDPASITGTAYDDQFTGTGSQTVFTLSNTPGSLASLQVSVGGLVQLNGVDFTWSSSSPTTLTFTTAPPNGQAILVQYPVGLAIGSTDSNQVAFSATNTYIAGSAGKALQDRAISVTDAPYNADPTGTTDSASATSTALTAYSAVSNPAIKMPQGTFLFSSAVTLPAQSALIGVEVARQGQPGNWISGTQLSTNGTQIFTNVGSGAPAGSPLFRMLVGSTLKNVSVWYTGQTKTDSSASIVQYPPTITVGQGSGGGSQNSDNCIIENVAALNCYEAMRIGDGTNPVGRTLVENCFFNPFGKGITVTSGQGDVVMLRKVFVENIFTTDGVNRPNLHTYLNQNLIGFDIGNAGGVNMTDCIALGCGYGVKVTSQSWAQIENCLFDYCALPFYANGSYRVSISNTKFINNFPGAIGPCAQIGGVVTELAFSNCLFGDYYKNVKVGVYSNHTQGTARFVGCTFTCGYPAVLNVGAGFIQLSGCSVRDATTGQLRPLRYDDVVGQGISIDGGPVISAGVTLALTNINPTAPAATGWTYTTPGNVTAITNGIQISSGVNAAANNSITYRPGTVSAANNGLISWNNGLLLLQFTLNVTGQAANNGSSLPQILILNDSSAVVADAFQICADTATNNSAFPEGVNLPMAVILPWNFYATQFKINLPNQNGAVWQITNMSVSTLSVGKGYTGLEVLRNKPILSGGPSGWYDASSGNQFLRGPTAPPYGTWQVGDTVLNLTPPASGTYSWICTTAGTPGTFTGISIP